MISCSDFICIPNLQSVLPRLVVMKVAKSSSMKVSKKAIKGMRRRLAAKGGQALAGNGSSAKAVARKVAKLKRKLVSQFGNRSPKSKRCSLDVAKSHGISYSVWKRELQ